MKSNVKMFLGMFTNNELFLKEANSKFENRIEIRLPVLI